MSAQRTIARCIRACAAAKDGRGRWRERDRCARELAVALTMRPACVKDFLTVGDEAREQGASA